MGDIEASFVGPQTPIVIWCWIPSPVLRAPSTKGIASVTG